MDETVIKRVMPHNGEAEEAVIGSMLLDQDAVVLASEKLNEDDFLQCQVPHFVFRYCGIVS